MGNDDAIVSGEIHHIVAGRHDIADELVPEDAARGRQSRRELEEICTTKATASKLQQHFAGSHSRDWPYFQACGAAFGARDDMHGAG